MAPRCTFPICTFPPLTRSFTISAGANDCHCNVQNWFEANFSSKVYIDTRAMCFFHIQHWSNNKIQNKIRIRYYCTTRKQLLRFLGVLTEAQIDRSSKISWQLLRILGFFWYIRHFFRLAHGAHGTCPLYSRWWAWFRLQDSEHFKIWRTSFVPCFSEDNYQAIVRSCM